MVVSPCSILGSDELQARWSLAHRICWLLGKANLGRDQEGALQCGSWGGKGWSLRSVGPGISGGFQFSFLVAKCRWQLRLASVFRACGRMECHTALRVPKDSITDCKASRSCCTLGITSKCILSVDCAPIVKALSVPY